MINILNAKIQLRNDTSTKWNANNPILLKGEIGIEIDTGSMKVGNGINNWNDLNYINASDKQLLEQITSIKLLIPNQTSSTNQLADKDFVNSSISTATATFKGTYTNVSDFPTTDVDANDYVWYDTVDSLGNRQFSRYKYSNGSWIYEYTLNNSSFTDAQWKAINSGVTKDFVNKAAANETGIANLKVSKLDLNDFNAFKIENNGNFSKVNSKINDINSLISTLQSYFSNGIAKNARADKDGNEITVTYETKNHASNTYVTRTTYTTHISEFEQFKTNVQALLSSDEATLDTLQEIVDYIKNNKNLIDGVTTNKINYTDIVDNLLTAVSNQPLSANQGVVLKSLIEGLNTNKVDKEEGKKLSTNDFTTALLNKLNSIEENAQQNTITGIKGSAETEYRTGNVSISKENIGLGNVGNFKAVSTVASQDLTEDEKANARANINTYSTDEIDSKIDRIVGGEANLQNYYTKTEMNEALDLKANKSDVSEVDIDLEGTGTIVSIPENATGYGTIEKLGGKSYKSENLYNPTNNADNQAMGDYVEFGADNFCATPNQIKILPNTIYSTNCIRVVAYGDVNGNYISGSRTFVDDYGGNERTFTTPSNAYYIKFDYPITFKGRVMLNEGSTALPYEPYFEGIKIEYPTNVKVVGRNLWSYSDNIILNNQTYVDINYELELETGTYYIKFDNNNSNSDGYIIIYNGSNNLAETFVNSSFTITNNIKTTRIRFFFNGRTGSSGSVVYTNIMLNKGSTALPYTPYTEQLLPQTSIINYVSTQLQTNHSWTQENASKWLGLGVGNDSNIIDYVNKKGDVKYTIINLGDLDWMLQYNIILEAVIPNRKPNANVLCAYAPIATDGAWDEKNLHKFIPSLTSGSISYRINEGEFTTDTFKQAMQGVMLIYELATPIEIDLSSLETEEHFECKSNGSIIHDNIANYKYSFPVSLKGQVALNFEHDKEQQRDIDSLKENASKVDTKLDKIKQEFENHIVECNCTHETEITGFGEEDCNLVIDDQDVVITKIQGQTRRKSLNIFNINAINSPAIIISDREFSARGYDYELFKTAFEPNTQYTISGYSRNDDTLGNNRLVVFYTDGTKDNEVLLNNTTSYIYQSYTTKANKTISYISHTHGNGGSGYYKDIMLNEGTEALPYEPFDDTLVNSKCDFVSKGRNLFDSSKYEATEWATYINENIKVIANTNYTISYEGNIANASISFYDKSNNNLSQEQYTSGRTFTTPNNCEYIKVYFNNQSSSSSSLVENAMLNYGDTALPYEPYIEDTMLCGLELGQWDWHDNVNHITHRKTNKIDLGTLSWIYENGWFLCETDIENMLYSTDNYRMDYGIISKYSIDSYNNMYNNKINKTFSLYSKRIRIVDNSFTNAIDFKNAMSGVMLYYETATETTEENILPSGYKVWYKGMQIQKTETIPYILTKQYGISLASQVLNNVSVDRSQQKQIEELKKEIFELRNTIIGELEGDY